MFFLIRLKPVILSTEGHIIKLRYTPLQFQVHTYEEKLLEKSPEISLKKYSGLNNTPVVIGELHSMVAPFVLLFKKTSANVFPT